MKWWKYIWLRIRHMKKFDQLVKNLKARSITPLTKEEEQIILFHLSIGEAPQTIIYLIIRRRHRAILMARLEAMGAQEDSLTAEELDWIEEILGNGKVSVDDAVKELKEARLQNRRLADAKTMG